MKCEKTMTPTLRMALDKANCVAPALETTAIIIFTMNARASMLPACTLSTSLELRVLLL